MAMKRLYKSDDNKILCGVCGGIGDYLGVDPVIIRLLWALFGLTGAGIIVYIIACFIMPRRPRRR